jgi:hypothetical protein
MLTTAEFRRLAVSSSTLESAHLDYAITGMVFPRVQVRDPVVVVAEVVAVVLEAVGVVMAVMVLVSCSLMGTA